MSTRFPRPVVDWSSQINPVVKRSWRAIGLLLVLLAILFALGGLSARKVRADAGGFPTPTFTITPIPTATSTFTPIPTITLAPTAVIPQPSITPPLLVITPAIPATPTATPRPTGRFSPLLCWPFAIIFILIVIIVGAALLRRG